MGVLALQVSSHLPCVKAARQANEPERQLHKTKERERGGDQRKKERKKGRLCPSYGVATFPVVAVENCVCACAGKDYRWRMTIIQAPWQTCLLSLVCVSCKTAEGLPAEKGLDAGLKSSSREGW